MQYVTVYVNNGYCFFQKDSSELAYELDILPKVTIKLRLLLPAKFLEIIRKVLWNNSHVKYSISEYFNVDSYKSFRLFKILIGSVVGFLSISQQVPVQHSKFPEPSMDSGVNFP